MEGNLLSWRSLALGLLISLQISTGHCPPRKWGGHRWVPGMENASLPGQGREERSAGRSYTDPLAKQTRLAVPVGAQRHLVEPPVANSPEGSMEDKRWGHAGKDSATPPACVRDRRRHHTQCQVPRLPESVCGHSSG